MKAKQRLASGFLNDNFYLLSRKFGCLSRSVFLNKGTLFGVCCQMFTCLEKYAEQYCFIIVVYFLLKIVQLNVFTFVCVPWTQIGWETLFQIKPYNILQSKDVKAAKNLLDNVYKCFQIKQQGAANLLFCLSVRP